MARQRTLIGAAVLLGAAIAVPATAAFAWGDDPPKPPAPPVSSPTVVPDPVTPPTFQGKKPRHEPPIVVHTSGPEGWAPPPLPIPPGLHRGKAPAPAKPHSAEPPQDQSPPPPPKVDLEPEDAGPN